jgi:hypothetical protein
MHPLWTGFLELVQSILVIEIGFYLYYSLVMTSEVLP